MISENSFSIAVPSAAVIAAAGKVAVAKPGTLISELVRLSVPVEMKDGNGATVQTTSEQKNPIQDWDTPSGYGYQVEYVTSGNPENPSLHTLEQDGYIADISKAVTKHVAHAKNNVRPLVSAFAEALQAYLTSAKPKEASEAYNIRTLRLPALLKDESFLDTLKGFKDTSILTPDVSLALEGKTKEELAEMVMMGHDRTNKLIAEWLSHKDDVFLLRIWANFFCKSGNSNSDVVLSALQYEDLSRMNAFDKADHALAILLLANKITSDVQESGLSLAAYKNICSQYVQYASAMLVDAMVKLDLAIRTKQLIIEKNTLKQEIAVNGEVYPQWLEAGGSPEVLMGAMVANGSGSSQAMIDEKKEEYLRQWNSFATFFRTKEQNAAFSYVKGFIETHFAQSLAESEETEAEFIIRTPNFKETVVAAAQVALDNMKVTDLQDPFAVALLFVAKIRYYYTSSYQILSDIEEVRKVNPNADVREAALLAVINYVSDYVADQITLSPN